MAIGTLGLFIAAQSPLMSPLCAQTEEKLSLQQDQARLTVSSGSRPILVYNIQSPQRPEGIDAVYERSGFLHPVYTPKGRVVTAAFPADHAHQHGIFCAWVKTTYAGHTVDFWNLAKRQGKPSHKQILSSGTGPSGQAEFRSRIIHQVLSPRPVDVLEETWHVTVLPTDGSYNCFEIQLEQIALTDQPLVVEKYHYGGFGIRGPVDWLLSNDGYVQADGGKKLSTEAPVPTVMLNSLGNDRLAGNHARPNWVAMTAFYSDHPASIVVMSHSQNFRSPQHTRLHPTKPYFCFSPCVEEAFTIDHQHPFKARYRLITMDRVADAPWLDEHWKSWTSAF